MTSISSLLLLPPIAVARLGGSDTPLESFIWREDPTIHGSGQTVIEPAVSLTVENDGLATPHLPGNIRFKDGDLIRPACPFFEVWAKFDGEQEETPLTADRLRRAGGSLAGVTWRIAAANLKAARRTGDAANGFQALVSVKGDEHRHQMLWASSPALPGTEPLVSAERPILLGQVQVLRPYPASELGVDLDVLRLRFTPGRGEVYGPPAATVGQAPDGGRDHPIVKPENRILNANASWCRYDASYASFDNPEPSDTYDGADVGTNRAWGVVDDTCDARIEVEIVLDGVRTVASARVAAAPPDFAPDRRPFVTLADDLADRDLVEPPPTDEESIEEIADLFQRVFETVSLANLDALRLRAIGDNSGTAPQLAAKPPRTDDGTMTAKDAPYADDKLTANLGPGGPRFLPYTEIAKSLHKPLADVENLVEFLQQRPDRARQLIRPPYAAVPELAAKPGTSGAKRPRRDARVDRDTQHDMRMPPYMRDSDASALSLTRRQYDAVMQLIDTLAKLPPARAKAGARTAVAKMTRLRTPLRKRIDATLARIDRQRRATKDQRHGK